MVVTSTTGRLGWSPWPSRRTIRAERRNETITLIGIEFDYHDFDERGDTLYLHVGAPSEPARAIETPEGHIVEYDDHGAVIGLELLSVTSILDRDGQKPSSMPQR